MKIQGVPSIAAALCLGGFLMACSDPNKSPEAVIETVDVEFNTPTEFTLKGSDPDGDAITFSIVNQPSIGYITAVDRDSQLFLYTPSAVSTSSTQFDYKVSDGEADTIGTITFDIVDTTTPIVSEFSPEDGAIRVEDTSSISVSFDDVMGSINYDPENSECHGGIQISADDFVTCAAFSEVSLSDDNRTFELTVDDGLQNDATYQIKVTADAQNFHGTSAAEEVVGSFTVESADLKITEVSASKWGDDNRWIEVYNGTAGNIDLADYSVKTGSINLDDFTDAGIQVFPVPTLELEPDEYAVVQGRFANGYWQTSVEQSEQLVLIGNLADNIRPSWYKNGFVELLNTESNQTIDFVRFGENLQAPTDATEWVGEDSAPALTDDLGMSLVRSIDNIDTNMSTDWTYSAFITPAGPNDVTCNDDVDEDGIPDCSEVEGATFAGLPLYDWGARQGVKDIFIEVDYMESDDPGITPHQVALQKVVDVFAQKGYAVHFDAGDLYHQAEGISAADFDLGGGNQIEYYAQTTFAATETSPSLIDHKVKNFDIRRKPIFHYMLMANSQRADGAAGSSGVAELWGNDLLISIGSWGLTMETEEAANTTINFQSGTILHELGHNLGLLHGGNDNLNYKPNYVSSMNYLYQLSGLPTIGEREGDRYYRTFFRDNLNCNLEGNELLNGFTVSPADFKMDYSSGVNASLDESSVNEALGLGHVDSVAVDFNCNADDSQTLVDFDINGNGQSNDVLNDVNEWAMLVLDFSRYWSGTVSGERTSSTSQHKIHDSKTFDQPRLIHETAPSESFFKELKKITHAK